MKPQFYDANQPLRVAAQFLLNQEFQIWFGWHLLEQYL